ncbi:hypothetical protein [Streptosporangium fragile]
MSTTRVRVRSWLGVVAALAAALVTSLYAPPSTASAAAVTLPPAHAGFDYQIGGAYPPPTGVRVVSRDRGDFTAAFGDNVIVIEYNAAGLSRACSGRGDTLSVVRRDVDVVPPGGRGYLRQTC